MNRADRDEKLLIYEASLCGLFSGLVEVFAVAYCIFLKATPGQIALLASLPLLVSSLAQLQSPNLLQKIGTRKRMLQWGALFQGLTAFAMAFAFLLGEKWGAGAIILGFCLSATAGQFIHPPWLSWVGDLLAPSYRGQFFSKRTSFNHLAMFAGTLLGGAFLSWITERLHLPQAGFCLLYIGGGILRLLTLPLLNKISEPPIAWGQPHSKPHLHHFLKNIFRHHFGLFVGFTCLVNLAIFMSHPFIAPYLLDYLKISYFHYSLLFSTLVLAKIIFVIPWGRWADRHPLLTVFSWSAILFAFTPFLWLGSSYLPYLFLVQTYRGGVWAGFEIASLKFMLDATPAPFRTYYISYHTVLNGLLGVVGSMLGALLVGTHWLEPPYFLVFLVAGGFQMVTSLIFLPKIKEARG